MNVSRHGLASLSPFIPADSASKTRVNALMAGNPGPEPGDERSLCAVCHLSSDMPRKRIRLTRVTRIFQLSVFTKFALAVLFELGANARCGLGPCYFPVTVLLF